jgi:hypothetical protein
MMERCGRSIQSRESAEELGFKSKIWKREDLFKMVLIASYGEQGNLSNII